MSGCTLLFVRNSPLRTTLIDETTGQAKYKIDTPRKVARIVTRIRKLDPSTRPLPHQEDTDSGPGGDIAGRGKKKEQPSPEAGNEGEEEEGDGGHVANSCDEIARIYWKLVSPNKIVFQGGITTRGKFMPKAGTMMGSFKFTGPDGIRYRWALGMFGVHCPRLVTMDEKKTVIAEFHPAHHILKKRKARLEIHPAGMHMLDHIVLTFVFAEDKRRQRIARASWDLPGIL